MSRLSSVGGVILAPEEAKVSVYDRGFLYGDSVFETIRTYGGVPFALDEHLARLERSAARVAIEVPVPQAQLREEILAVLAAAQNPESYARVMISRGSGPLGLDPDLAREPLRVILVEPLVPLPAALYRDGVAVITYRTERAGDAAHGAKVGNYLGSLLALKAARAAGAHEALILDARGRVVEGTTSNVFLVRRGTLVTPPEEAGLLAGITRAILFDLAAEKGIHMTLQTLSQEDIQHADEIFLSSSMREVLPVVRVDGRKVASGAPGPVTRLIHKAFRERAGVGDKPMPWE